jgi:hypothetical protein
MGTDATTARVLDITVQKWPDAEAIVDDAATPFQMTPELSPGDDGPAAIVGHVTASPAGKTLDVQNVLIVRCEDGQISTGWTIPVDQYAYDEFWE